MGFAHFAHALSFKMLIFFIYIIFVGDFSKIV